MFQKCNRQTNGFITKLIDGKRNYRALYDLIQDLLIAPVAVGYYFVGRFMLAKTFYSSSSCDMCGVCKAQCPVKAISIVQNRMFWSYRCESCMKCMNNCPKRSIQTAHGYITGILFLFYGTILAVILSFFEDQGLSIIKETGFFSGLILFIIRTISVFLTLIISYRIVHYLRRFRFFDSLIYYTSLTRYTFWRRYKAPHR